MNNAQLVIDEVKKEYPEILSVKFMLQQKNGMEIF